MNPYTCWQAAFGEGAEERIQPLESLSVLDHLDETAYFETMRAYRGRIFQLDKHLARLDDSCKGVARRLPWAAEGATALLYRMLEAAGPRDAVLRFSLHWARGRAAGRAVCLIKPFSGHPSAWYQDGVELRSAVPRRSQPRAQEPQIKATQFVSGVLASIDQGEARAHESLLLGPGGLVAEGSVSNVFAVKARTLLTPSAASGILKGITRDLVIALAREAGWPVTETLLTRHDFYTADECFMTNTSSEVLPVVRIDGRRIGAGTPGPVTRALADKFKRFVEDTLR